MLVFRKFNLGYALTLGLMVILLCVSAFAANVVYVKDGGSGSGASASAPVGSFTDAYNALGDEGGTIVVCGTCTISEQFIAPTHTGTVTVTSKYNGTNYASTNSAAIEFYQNYYLSGPTIFNYITLRTCTDGTKTHPYNAIFGRANDLTIGTAVKCVLGDGCSTYLSIIGGSGAVYKNKTSNILIKSGTWQRFRGGSNKGGSNNYDINIKINGGTFHERFILATASPTADSSHIGDINAIINGGTFIAGIYLTGNSLDTDVYSGDSTLTINGGTFYETIGVAYDTIGTASGSFTVTLNGGEFQHLVALKGSEGFSGDMESYITFADDVDIEAEETGTVSFTNYLRKNNADPFMFYHDGYYYYTATGASTIQLIRVANIADIKTVAGHTILEPADYTDLWSPEIHYFTADEIGEENAGWYMFVGAKEKDSTTGTVASNQRQYVAKCLDGDNLLGSWGDPVTGEANVLRKVTFENGGYNEDELCGGSSPIRINGKLYVTFVSEVGRGTSNFHQTINITTIDNPWTYTGTPVAICRSDYDWEKGGYWYGANEDGVMTWWPQVVEGASAVYSPSGDVYLMYTGSGYWTVDYALGYLKFTGSNPLSKSSWTKNPTPVLRRVDNLTEDSVNGCGHGSYFTDHAGQMWVAYHGYIGVDTSSKRFSFVEPIYVTSSGVSIGKKTGNPAPIDTVYNVTANPMSLAEKMSGFTELSVKVTSDLEDGVTIRYNPIDDITAYIIRRDGQLLYSGTNISIVDTEATPGSHKYTVQAVKKGSIVGNVTVYAVAANNLRFKDINEDGEYNIVDALLALDDYLNKHTLGVEFIDIVQMVKCIPG